MDLLVIDLSKVHTFELTMKRCASHVLHNFGLKTSFSKLPSLIPINFIPEIIVSFTMHTNHCKIFG